MGAEPAEGLSDTEERLKGGFLSFLPAPGTVRGPVKHCLLGWGEVRLQASPLAGFVEAGVWEPLNPAHRWAEIKTVCMVPPPCPRLLSLRPHMY